MDFEDDDNGVDSDDQKCFREKRLDDEKSDHHGEMLGMTKLGEFPCQL